MLALVGNTDNGIITYVNASTSGQVESNLVFDGYFLTISGSAQITGSVSASAFNVYGSGTPQVSSPTTLNLTATNGVTLSPSLTTTGFVKSTTYRETYSDLGTGGSVNIDLSTANNFRRQFNAGATITFSNSPASSAFGFTLIVVNGGSGTLIWPGTVDWAGGAAPTNLQTTGTDILVFYTYNGGTNFYGFHTGVNMS